LVPSRFAVFTRNRSLKRGLMCGPPFSFLDQNQWYGG
jgi:hypothetical protein